MKSLIFKLTIVFVGAYLALGACGMLGSEEKDQDPVVELEPGSRNYSWSVDSVYSAPDGWLNTIWGISANEVWAGSVGGWTNLWRFNGEKWIVQDRIPGSVISVFATFEHQIWIGSNGGIYEQQLGKWNKVFRYSKEGYREPDIKDIHGMKRDELYAVGITHIENEAYWRSFVLHFNGEEWQELLVTDHLVQFQVVRSGNQGVFIRALKPAAPGLADSLVLYKLEGLELEKLLTVSTDDEGAMIWVNTIQDNVYIIASKQLYSYKKEELHWVVDFSDKEIVYSFFGRTEKDIFVITNEGVEHFNGTDTQVLVSKIVHPSAILFERDVFFFRRQFDVPTNLIFHGKMLDEEIIN